MIRVSAVVLVVMVLMSGCAGFGGSGGADGASESTPTAAAGGGGGSGSADEGVDPAGDFGEISSERQMADYIDRYPNPVFRPGEYYQYEGTSSMMSQSGESMPVAIEIQSREGGEWMGDDDPDIVVMLERGEETVTYSQDDDNMDSLLYTEELFYMAFGRTWIWISRAESVTNVEPRISELSVGDTWSSEPDPESGTTTGFRFEVTEQRSYAGQDCLLVQKIQFGGEETWLSSETCVSADIGMPLSYTEYVDDGSVMMDLELVDYQR